MTTDPEEFSQEIHHASPERPVDVIYDAVFRFELETGQITEWNAGAEELYGWRRQDALGRQPHELLKTMHDGRATTSWLRSLSAAAGVGRWSRPLGLATG